MKKLTVKIHRSLSNSHLASTRGGIWDYSNRLGELGQMLEDKQDRNYGDPLGVPDNLDDAYSKVHEGWISIP